MKLEFSPKVMSARGGLLDKVMENCFDASILVDSDLRIVYISKSGAKLSGTPQAQLIGSLISDEPRRARFKQVIGTGVSLPSQLTELFGLTCILTVLPIFWRGKTVGALGMILHKNLGEIKRILSILQTAGRDNLYMSYNSVSRMASTPIPADYVGESNVVKNMLRECANIAKTPYPVLITGETGTGKEIIAGIIHSLGSSVPFSPYISINCTAIPDSLLESELFGHVKGAFTGAITNKRGKFELAAGGSLLLDEIGDMAVQLQAKLLRALESREFEKLGDTTLLPLRARVIASTNCDILEKCRRGTFRQDLYYRLSTFEISVPPLRNRVEDIPLLVNHFIEHENLRVSFDDASMNTLMRYKWPGNIRQLRNIVLRLGVRKIGEVVTDDDVRDELCGSNFLSDTGRDISVFNSEIPSEKSVILHTLSKFDYNLSKVSRALNISRTTLYKRINKYGINVSEYRQ